MRNDVHFRRSPTFYFIKDTVKKTLLRDCLLLRMTPIQIFAVFAEFALTGVGKTKFGL
jgi:hypothetical protein